MGDDILGEVESSVGLQLRYRHSKLFEPALELYKGQDTFGLGPALRGNINVGVRKNLTWEAGLILGLDNASPKQTVRMLECYWNMNFNELNNDISTNSLFFLDIESFITIMST